MRKIVCLLLVLMLPLCSGCLKAHSLDRYGYVIAIGFDPGEKLPYKITLLLQNMHMEEGSQTSAGFTLVSAECHSLFEAIDTLSANLPFALDFSRTMVMTFAMELVQKEGTLEELLSASFSDLYIRYNANIYVALTTAAEVYKGMENEMEPNQSKAMINHILYSKTTGLVPVTNLTILLEAIRQPYEDPILPVCGTLDKGDAVLSGQQPEDGEPPNIGGSPLVKSELKTGLAGTALFAGGQMVGLLDGRNTQALLMAYGKFEEGRVHAKLDDTEICLFVQAAGKPEVKLSLGERPAADVKIRLRAALEQPETVNAQQMQEITALLEEQLEKRLSELFLACRTLGSDAMGFGRYAVKRFSTGDAWHSYDWATAYRRLDASFTVTVEFEQAAGRTALE